MDLTDDDGPPNWGLAKITAVLDKEEFDLHWFGTYSKAKSLAGFGSGFGKSPGRTFGYLLFCAVFYVGSPVAVLYAYFTRSSFFHVNCTLALRGV